MFLKDKRLLQNATCYLQFNVIFYPHKQDLSRLHSGGVLCFHWLITISQTKSHTDRNWKESGSAHNLQVSRMKDRASNRWGGQTSSWEVFHKGYKVWSQLDTAATIMAPKSRMSTVLSEAFIPLMTMQILINQIIPSSWKDLMSPKHTQIRFLYFPREDWNTIRLSC